MNIYATSLHKCINIQKEHTRMFEQFKSILVDDMSIDPNLVTMDAELTADLGINSLELADLILLCEDKLGVEIDDKQLSKFISVGDVVNYLQSLE